MVGGGCAPAPLCSRAARSPNHTGDVCEFIWNESPVSPSHLLHPSLMAQNETRLGLPIGSTTRTAQASCNCYYSSHNKARPAGWGWGVSVYHLRTVYSVTAFCSSSWWPVLCLCDPAKVWIIHQVLRLKAKPSLTSKLNKSQSARREARGEKHFLEICHVVWFHKISCQGRQ